MAILDDSGALIGKDDRGKWVIYPMQCEDPEEFVEMSEEDEFVPHVYFRHGTLVMAGESKIWIYRFRV
jgi:hypothetical protein